MRFFCGTAARNTLALILHLATWYLNFTLRTDVSAWLLCLLDRFKSTTRRADGYCRALFCSLYNRGFIKRPFGFLVARADTVLRLF